MGLLDSIGGQIGGAIMGMATGGIANDMQYRQQQRLSELQMKNQREMGIFNREQQMKLWEDTNYKAQTEQMRKAGLNIGMMYAGGGQGGQTNATPGNVSGGNAEGRNQLNEGMALMMQNRLQEAQIKNIEADTQKKIAETTTEDNSRNVLIENMRQSGIGQMYENIKTKMMREGYDTNNEVSVFKNMVYGIQGSNYDEFSPEVKQFNADLFKTVAEEKNLDANALLSNKKAEAIWKELLIAQQNADANTINAKANELSKLWETGEFTNWKTWADLAKSAVDGVGGLIKNIKTTPIKGK